MVNFENFFLAFVFVISILVRANVEALQNRTRLRGSTARVHHWHTRIPTSKEDIAHAITECAADGRELGSMGGRVIVELVVMIPALPGRFLNANDNTFVDNAEYRLAA